MKKPKYKLTKVEKPMLKSRDLKKVIFGHGSVYQQKCIMNVPFLDFLDNLPKDVEVAYGEVRNSPFQARIPVVHNKALGEKCNTVRVKQLRTSFEATVSFRDSSKKDMRDVIYELSRTYGIPESEFLMRNILLRRGDALVYLVYTTKKLTDAEGKNNRVAMLGLESISADPEKEKIAMSILDDLVTTDYQCKLVTETKKVAYCSKN